MHNGYEATPGGCDREQMRQPQAVGEPAHTSLHNAHAKSWGRRFRIQYSVPKVCEGLRLTGISDGLGVGTQESKGLGFRGHACIRPRALLIRAGHKLAPADAVVVMRCPARREDKGVCIHDSPFLAYEKGVAHLSVKNSHP